MSSVQGYTERSTGASRTVVQIILYVSNNDASLLSGVVPAHSSLQCEFVCLPTHESADSALFRLVVLGEGGGAGGVASSEGGSTVVVGTAEESNFLTLKAEVCVCACVCVCVRARTSVCIKVHCIYICSRTRP